MHYRSNMRSSLRSNIKKYEAGLWIFIVLTGIVLLGVGKHMAQEGNSVCVRVGGEQVASFPLDIDRTYTIQGADGGVNELVINDGKIWISNASCPDELCVKQGHISGEGQSIICLPNKVVIEVQSQERENDSDKSDGAGDEVDAVTG